LASRGGRRLRGKQLSRILIWSPNYAPELTGIPPLVTDACRWLVGVGHVVEVVTALPNYPERRIDPAYRGSVWRSDVLDGVSVHRSWLRVRPGESFLDKALYEASFTALSLPRILRRLRRSDVLVCVVPSLLAAVAAAKLSRVGGPRLVLWWQDLVLVAARSLDGLGPLAVRVLASAQAAERMALRAADHVVTCSPGFVDYLVEQGGRRERISTVLNWVDTDWIAPVEASASTVTRVLYAGNLGYTQGFETVIEAMRALPEEVELELVGEGNAADHIRRLVKDMPRVHVRPPVSHAEFPALLAASNIQLVLQRRIGAGANLPSKIGPYLASGRAVVASIDPMTAAAALLEESGGALIVPPEDPVALAQALRRLHHDRRLRDDLARRGRAYAVHVLGRDAALVRLEREFIGD
jgi:colanic acid biosynthesis glycosyl transferase WcaI